MSRCCRAEANGRGRSIRRWGTLSSNQSDDRGGAATKLRHALPRRRRTVPTFKGRGTFLRAAVRASVLLPRPRLGPPPSPCLQDTPRCLPSLLHFTGKVRSVSLLGSLSESESQLSEAKHAAAGVRLSLSIFRPKQRRHNAEETARTKKTEKRLNE